MKRERKETKVFALILENHVYIGRTTAQKVSAVCYGHYRGRHQQTADCFGASIRRPDLYILERVTAHATVTDRYVVAWTQVFAQAGYHILNQDCVSNDTELAPETAVIVDEIQSIPLEDRLAQCHYAKYTDADSRPVPPVPQVHNEPATVKLTIRLSDTEKHRFDQVAQALGLTHREALQYLLQHSPDTAPPVPLRENRQKKRIAELEESLSTQREKLAQQTEAHRKYVAMVQKGLGAFMRYFDSTSTFPMAIEVDWYSSYMRNCQTDFAYPTQEGFALVRPIAVLRGHGKQPALFVLAVTATGQCIKLRYYLKQDYVGLFLTNPQFGVRGSSWLVGWQRAEENVMQLTLALPLQIQTKYQNPMDPHERLRRITEEF